MPKKKNPPTPRSAAEYRHEEKTPARPDVGTQPQFRKKAAPRNYRYDSSLSPALDWDGQNSSREQGEALIEEILQAKKLDEAKSAAKRLSALSKPFLNWAGKAERLSFDVPTMPLFVHDRLSTRAILETLKGHRRDKQLDLFDLFSDPQRPIHDQVLRAYEYQDQWVNRMILGDSLVVMNSLLHYESLGGQVQMIYMDPPYGVKFGSNFQPFVRKRDVTHNDDDDMTREPEMVQAYRDTWDQGLHSYLTYLRDRLLLCRDLLSTSGSIFVQISDENLHHAREVMDEVFGSSSHLTTIVFQKTGSEETDGLANTADYLLWYAKDPERVKYRQTYVRKVPGGEGARQYLFAMTPSGEIRRLTQEEISRPESIPVGDRICLRGYPLTSQDFSPTRTVPFKFEGKSFHPGENRHWSVDPDVDLPRLVKQGRIYAANKSLRGIMFLSDQPVAPRGNVWSDTGTGSFTDDQIYVVQTSEKVVERCLLMATDPGDLVLDPTCGSGTSAYVSERWGRRWITCDTSRVPLALARQRLLSATFKWFKLNDAKRGPAAGFEYLRRTNSKGEDEGGIVPHATLKSIAVGAMPEERVLVDRPEEDQRVTRVSGPFVVEGTIPTTLDLDDPVNQKDSNTSGNFIDRMLEVLRHSPTLRLEGNRTVTIHNLRRPAKSLSLSAEAMVKDAEGAPRSVCLVFGPENGAVVERLVYEAAKEATAKNYTHLYVIGFAIQPNARQLVDSSEAAIGVPATYVQATPDLMMGDLLKNMRSSQIFSVCGLPEIELRKVKKPAHLLTSEKPPKGSPPEEWYEVELLGIDVFDPATMEVHHKAGNDVPAWFLDTDYNGLSFHVSQAFFPRTAAWDNLKRSLKGEYDDEVWNHLAGNVSVAFEPGEHREIAIKVIDDRGNELMIVKSVGDKK